MFLLLLSFNLIILFYLLSRNDFTLDQFMAGEKMSSMAESVIPHFPE